MNTYCPACGEEMARPYWCNECRRIINPHGEMETMCNQFYDALGTDGEPLSTTYAADDDEARETLFNRFKHFPAKMEAWKNSGYRIKLMPVQF